MVQLQVLMTGLAIGESPRWHDGRLWFSHWGERQILSLGPDGTSEVMVEVPTTFPFCFDWLSDGRLLVVSGPEALLLRREPDGSLVTHADLGPLAKGWNEIVVDGRDHVYVNGSDFDFRGGGPFIPGIIGLVTPDGEVRQVADGIAFANGMAVTPDGRTLIVAESFASRLTAFDIAADGSLSNRRVWAQLADGVDGICLDAEGAVWAATMNGCERIGEGGQVLQRVELDRFGFACMLGGEDRRTLHIMAAVWHGIEHMFDGERTGQVLAVRVAVPGAGHP